ncbi:MAG TPA: response regulator [Anaerolineales bacterium]|nr:response regulator [Anaerolineales bacterium]
MDRFDFEEQIRELLGHLYDHAALETHALTGVLKVPSGHPGSRGEYVRQAVLEAIERLKPVGREPSQGAPEWRPYLILYKRYVDGLSPQELSEYLSLGDRQLRRDHSRAVQALAGLLWDAWQVQENAGEPQKAGPKGAQTFEIHPERLDLKSLVQGVVSTMERRAVQEGIDLRLFISENMDAVMADRIVLRQIMISLLSYAFRLQSNGKVGMDVLDMGEQVEIHLRAALEDGWSDHVDEEQDALLKSARYWSEQQSAGLEVFFPRRTQAGEARLVLALPRGLRPVILVVDDQAPTLRMYQRYLSRYAFDVVGVSDPTQVLALARKLRPQLITLDVMMPHVDGWELLQALQADGFTSQIPVVVCSAWEEPELARSLGAAYFLKKPITQRDLLAVLEQLDLLPS